MRRKELLELMRKKKAPPFHGKVVGGTARKRADRKAYRRGGTVASKADGEPINPTEPNAPAGGAVRQKFQEGGEVGRRYGAEGALIRTRRQYNAPRPPWTEFEQEFTRHPSKEFGYAGTGKRATDTEEEDVEKKKRGGGTGKWIGKARASMERRGTVGSLRKAMGAKEGQKIPTGSLQAKKAQAKRTGNTAMMRKVQFALNVRK